MKSWQSGMDFKDLLLADKRVSSKVNKQDINAIFDVKKVLKNIDYIFKNAGIK